MVCHLHIKIIIEGLSLYRYLLVMAECISASAVRMNGGHQYSIHQYK